MKQKTNTSLSVARFRQVLVAIADKKLSLGVRYRIMGEMWQPNFMRVLKVAESGGLLLHDPVKNKLIAISEISAIIQFELDGSLYDLEPYFHYGVHRGEDNG